MLLRTLALIIFTGAGAGSAAASDVHCSAVSGGYVVTRTTDGRTLGLPASQRECEEAVAASRGGVVCVPQSSGGTRRWKARHIEGGHWVGRYPVTAEECAIATRAAGAGVVCSHTGLTIQGRTGWKPTNIAKADDQGFMGSSAWLEFCQVATRGARNGYVCANGNGGTGDHAYWWPHRIATGSLAPGARPADVHECSRALP